MVSNKLTIFTIGYSDNLVTSHLLNYFIQQDVQIEGAIFIKNKLRGDWRRVINKMKMRGWMAAFKRIVENLLLRKKEISTICQKFINKLYFVDEINSEEVRNILLSNHVNLIILTSTPIIKKILLDIEDLIILNAHTGWLPRYRGLDANLKAMRDGHIPGVSVHKVTKRIDAGEVYLREKFNIDYTGDILKQMDKKELQLSGKLLVKMVDMMSKNMLLPIAQSEPLGKYESALTKNERKTIIKDLRRAHQV